MRYTSAPDSLSRTRGGSNRWSIRFVVVGVWG